MDDFVRVNLVIDPGRDLVLHKDLKARLDAVPARHRAHVLRTLISLGLQAEKRGLGSDQATPRLNEEGNSKNGEAKEEKPSNGNYDREAAAKTGGSGANDLSIGEKLSQMDGIDVDF